MYDAYYHRGLQQTHTHEFVGSSKLAELGEDPHNHRVAGVTGKEVPSHNGNHYHKIEDNTDFFNDHYHIIDVKTGPGIPVGNGRHVHFVDEETTVNEGHKHATMFATLIENPIGDNY